MFKSKEIQIVVANHGKADQRILPWCSECFQALPFVLSRMLMLKVHFTFLFVQITLMPSAKANIHFTNPGGKN